MGKFSATLKRPRTRTVNLAGGSAYSETPKLELASILLTSFLKDKFYEREDQVVSRLINLITQAKDKKFVAKAAIYARTKFGMRSVSHLVAGELANQVKGEEWTKNFFDKVVHRADDITEILAYYLKNFGKPIPNSLKKGLAKAFDKFDQYGLAKYRGEGDEIKLVDAVNICHPVPTEKNGEALRQLVKGTLKCSEDNETWESVSSSGKFKTKKEKWEYIIDFWTKGKIKTYFAILRNARNVLEAGVDEVYLNKFLEALTNREAIEKSLVLPFRYQTAIKEIEVIGSSEARKVIKALNKAIDIACDNVPKFDGKTLIVLDTSGSMVGQPLDIGSLFAAVLIKGGNDVDFMGFSDHAYYMSLNNEDSTLTIAQTIQTKARSGGTNFNCIFTTANKAYDRIVILSDLQGWGSTQNSWSNIGGSPDKTFADYKRKYNCNPKVFSFDLAGYGSLMFPEPNVYTLAGWSEKTLNIMQLLEQNKKALEMEIESIEI